MSAAGCTAASTTFSTATSVDQRRKKMNNPLFQVHTLNQDGMVRAEKIANCFDELLEKLEVFVGGGVATREFSLAKTKLEESCFFAKKAMANTVGNQA